MPHTTTIRVSCLLLLLLSGWTPAFAAEEPSIHGLSPRQEQQLRSALALAIKQVDRKSNCRTLFQVLGQDGAQLLERARFSVPDPEGQRQVCNQGAAALFTSIGGRQITVCQQTFDDLDRSELAVLLIHEALHMAGVGENPPIQGAPTSAGLNKLVRRSCSG